MEKFVIAIALSLGLSVQVFAGALLVNETTYDSSKVVKSTVSVGEKSIRVDVVGGKGIRTVIYRGDQQVFWMLNEKKKIYTEMTKAQMDKTEMEMEKALKELSPSMRKRMQKKLGIPWNNATKYIKKPYKGKIGNWKATFYEAEENGKTQKMWTVPEWSLGLTASDLSILKEFSKFFERFGRNESDFFKFDRTDLGFAGVPVKTMVMEKGKAKSVSELKESIPQSFPASTFDVPAGYKKKEMKGM
jgi:hypothetical protein